MHSARAMPSAFFTLVSLFFVALFVLGVVVQLRTWRKQRAVRPWMIVLGQAAAFVSMLLFSVLTARPPGPLAWVLLLGLGGAGGLVYGRFVRVARSGAGVQMSYTLPWVVTWSVLMVLTQLNAALFHRVPVVLYGFAIVNLGLNLGMNASVLRAYRRAAAVATAGLVLASALPLRPAGAAQDSLPEVPASLATATLKDAARSLGWPDANVVALPHAYLFHSMSKAGTAEVPIRSCAVPPCGTMTEQLHFMRGLMILRSTDKNPFPSATGRCLDWEAPRTFRGMRGCASTTGTDQAWSFEQDGKVLLAFRADELRCVTSSLAKPPGLTCEEDPGAGARVAEALHEAALRNGLYAFVAAETQAGAPAAVAADEELAPRPTPAPDSPTPAPAMARDEPPAAPPVRAPGTKPRPAGGGVARRPAPDDNDRSPWDLDTLSRPDEAADAPSDDGEDAPLEPAAVAGAVALSSLTLLGGSLLQLLPGLLGSRPIGTDAVPPPPSSPEPPVDPAEDHARRMEAQGYRWSDRDGWVTDEQAREYQGQRDRAWREHLKQDAELARIEGEIRKAREAQEAARAAQAAADRKLQLMDQQRELERQQAAARAELQQADWMGRAVDAVQMAADTAIGEIAEVTGPVGQAIRAGYNSAKGMATVVGEAIAEGRGLKPADVRRGLWLGAQNVAFDMGLDAAGRRLTGQPGLFDEAADAAARTARASEALADPLARKAEQMREALAAKDPDAVLRLYEDGGMKKLAELEKAGRIGAEEAAGLNATLSKAVDRAVDRGTRKTLDVWEKGNPGVRLKEVLVGDSGSSAVQGKARSVLTDFDRTTVPVFDPDDVSRYAAGRGITPAQAHQELTTRFKSIHEEAVGEALPGGLTAKDVDYKSYGGFGSKAGQSDAYPSGFATSRQATQGRTTVYPSGGGRPHAASREAIVDQWDMEIARHGGPGPGEIAPRIAPQEFPGIAHEQVKAIAEKADPKSVAKAVDRVAYMAQRSEVRVSGYAMDESLARLAAEVKKNPRDAMGVLERAGVTAEEFARRALEEARRLQGTVAGWDVPPSGG